MVMMVAADAAEYFRSLPIGLIEMRLRVGVTQAHVRPARFATGAADEQAGGKDHDAERPDVRHPDVPAGNLISLPVSFATRNKTHADVGEKDRAGDGLMEMRRQPGGVVHDVVEIVGGVDDAGDSAKNENEQAAEEIGEQPAILCRDREVFSTSPADRGRHSRVRRVPSRRPW